MDTIGRNIGAAGHHTAGLTQKEFVALGGIGGAVIQKNSGGVGIDIGQNFVGFRNHIKVGASPSQAVIALRIGHPM